MPDTRVMTPVFITIYDLSSCWNTLAHPCGLALYRTGIQIEGIEYTYDSTPADALDEGTSTNEVPTLRTEALRLLAEAHATGVSWHIPAHEQATAALREKKLLGHTALAAAAAHDALQRLSPAWLAVDYHAFELNCHHWCEAAALELGVPCPSWIHGFVRVLRFCTDSGRPSRKPAAQDADLEPLCRREAMSELSEL